MALSCSNLPVSEQVLRVTVVDSTVVEAIVLRSEDGLIVFFELDFPVARNFSITSGEAGQTRKKSSFAIPDRFVAGREASHVAAGHKECYTNGTPFIAERCPAFIALRSSRRPLQPWHRRYELKASSGRIR